MSTVVLCFYPKPPLSPQKSVQEDPGTSETQEQRGSSLLKGSTWTLLGTPLHLIQRRNSAPRWETSVLVTDLQLLRPGGWCSLRLQELCRSLGRAGVSTHISYTQLLDELSNPRRKSALLPSSPLVTPFVSLEAWV